MSTIASPRGSLALSSRRNSTSTTDTVTTDRPNPQASTNINSANRRNRSALRDYYNLQQAAPSNSSLQTGSVSTDHLPSPNSSSTTRPEEDNNDDDTLFDEPTFNPSTHTSTLLSNSSLNQIWRTTASLTSQIRNLDGEKKSLVYDNYAKLITATETIRKMRERMDPMTPATRTLAGAIGDVAVTAETLRGDLLKGSSNSSQMEKLQQGSRETVKWVLAAPERLDGLLRQGEVEEARSQWRDVRGLLEKWEGVKGVGEVRTACEEVMKGG